MRAHQFVFAVGTIVAVASAAHAKVVISEVLYNEVSSNTAGEFIEIYNNGVAAVDISGYKVGDIETRGKTGESGGMLQFPTGTSIAAGQAYVIAGGASQFEANYGFKPDFDANATVTVSGVAGSYGDPGVAQMTSYAAWDPDGGAFSMANTGNGDQALVLDGDDNIVDSVSWGNTFAFDPALAAYAADGQSIFRTDPKTDTDTASDWALTTAAPANAAWTTRSSPGTVPAAATPEPASFALIGVCAVGKLRRRR